MLTGFYHAILSIKPEFLLAENKQKLVNFLKTYDIKQPIPEVINEQLLSSYKAYAVVGGMPAAVAEWVKKRDLATVQHVHHDIVGTYRDDFAKYAGRLSIDRLDEVLTSVPRMLARKFVYSRVNRQVNTESVKLALTLLSKSRLCHKVYGTAANGIPLASEINHRMLKVLLLDVGLCSSILGLRMDQYNSTEDIISVKKGAIAEQMVGQLLRTIQPKYIMPELYYWARETSGSSAEIDYILSHANHIVPIEVKAGSEGKLRSLHYFMNLKKLPLAVRIYSGQVSFSRINTKLSSLKVVKYSLLSLPFYLVEQLPRLLEQVL